MTDDFFRSRLDGMIDARHPLAVLGDKLPWSKLEASIAPIFAHQPKPVLETETGFDFAGEFVKSKGGDVGNKGRPRLSLRLMIALTMLKNSFNCSDEDLVQRFADSVTWQYFAGYEYFDSRLPCDATQVGRFRTALGEAGLEEILSATIKAALDIGAVKKSEFERLIVDTTVQEKAISHPTDSRLLDIARRKVVQAAKRAGIELKQTFEKEGKELRRSAGGYAHAKQFKRLGRTIKRQKTILGVLLREVQRKLPLAKNQGKELETLQMWLERATRIHTQKRKDKDKLYALHAPEVECIGKVRREVANIIVSPAHKVGDETGRSVDRSLPVHALLATASCEATGTKCRALGPRRIPRGNGVTCEHQCGWDARLSGMVNKSELLKASLCMTSQRC